MIQKNFFTYVEKIFETEGEYRIFSVEKKIF